MPKLTKAQERILMKIYDYAVSWGKFPTYSEMCSLLEVTSKMSVAGLIGKLKEKGCLRVEYGKKRGLLLTAKGVHLARAKQIPNDLPGEVTLYI